LEPFSKPPKYSVFDDFLPVTLCNDLLEFALANERDFHPTKIVRGGAMQIDPAFRRSSWCKAGLGPHKAAVKAAIHAHLDEILPSLGVPGFAIARTELELTAHGDKAFYKTHIDTHTGAQRAQEPHYRVVSLVYYFYREPKGFSGGEIALHPFGMDDEANVQVVEPLHNRLLAFPAITQHEVRKVSCPSGNFADSRFAINCWLHKQRAQPE
jgi:Rps23 Pro-64 3,4-dihydroxylase Tpa1-like proline 4-hydroxylase